MLVKEKPELEQTVSETLSGLQKQWEELESTTQAKAQCLFDANRAELFTQSCSALDSWLQNISSQLQSDDFGKDLTSVNILLKKHQVNPRPRKITTPDTHRSLLCEIKPSCSPWDRTFECVVILSRNSAKNVKYALFCASRHVFKLMTPYVTLYLCVSQMLEHQMEVREKEVQSLQSQALALAQEDSGTVEVDGQQRRVTDSFAQLQDPLKQRRQHLLASKEAHQFNRDLEDEIVSHKQEQLHCKKQ